jgi:hypothetical protein
MRRMRCASATHTLCSSSHTAPNGPLQLAAVPTPSCAAAAAALAPAGFCPLPLRVVTIPSGDTLRMRQPSSSVTYRLLSLATAQHVKARRDEKHCRCQREVEGSTYESIAMPEWAHARAHS